MKEKLKNIFKDGRLAIFLFIVFELFLMMFVNTNSGDDILFRTLKTGNSNTVEVVKLRYTEWSSRVIIEFVLIEIITSSKIIWALLQSLMMGLLAYSISKLFIKKELKEKLNPLIIALVLTYPISVLTVVGWGASTINYIWPLATCLFAIIPIKKYYAEEKIRWFEYPLYSLALIFAANMEQTAAILLGTYLLFTLLLIIKEKKIRPFMIIQLILVILSVIFILKSPGNMSRMQDEMAGHFKDFGTLSIAEKFTLGLTSTVGDILKWTIDFAPLILCISIVVYIFSEYKENLYRVISIIPLVIISTLGILLKYLNDIFPNIGTLSVIFQTPEVTLTTANINNIVNFLPITMAIILFGFMALSILIIFKKIDGNVPLIVFLAGLASRLIASFSATVFISAPRTMIFFDFAMLIVSLLIIQELLLKKKEKAAGFLSGMIWIIAWLQVLNLIMVIFK